MPAPVIKKSLPRFDVAVDRTVCDRYNNFDLWLILKLCLKKIDPPGGAAEGTRKDSNGDDKKIVRWGGHWKTWRNRFKREVETFWAGKFWLKAPNGFPTWDFQDGGATYRPNAWCRFRLLLVSKPGSAHHTIECVRLHKDESFFRSHSRLYDDRDIDPSPQSHGGVKRTHIHEVGHLLGLGHVGELMSPLSLSGLSCNIAQALFPDEGTNHDWCYGVSDKDERDVMGSGSVIRTHHARPWQEAVQAAGGGSLWSAAMRRHYPRDEAQVASGKYPTTRPRR